MPSLIMTAPVSASRVLSEEAFMNVEGCLHWTRTKPEMRWEVPCQLTANLAGPSHSRASASFSASDVVSTTSYFTMHGDTHRSGSNNTELGLNESEYGFGAMAQVHASTNPAVWIGFSSCELYNAYGPCVRDGRHVR